MIKRGDTYHFRMRVPREYLAVAGKSEIHRSLKTDSKRKAQELVPSVRKSILSDLNAIKVKREQPEKADAYSAAQAIIKDRGFGYMNTEALLDAPLEETLARFESISEDDDVETVRALLGGLEETGLRLSELGEVVETYRANDNRYKNDDQLRKWRNPRKKAVANLMKSIGNKDILVSKIDNKAALKHKSLWEKKIADEKVEPETANKDFIHMRSLLKDYYASINEEKPPTPYAVVSVKKDRFHKPKRKKEIPVEWIKTKWFAPEAFDELNDEARDILLMSIETGCRQSEISNLPPNSIVLDHPIPHLKIDVEEGEYSREVKNAPSRRVIPLVGVALAAAKRHPNGFPRYRGSSNYSATINDYLHSKGLMPSLEHTAGGVRHSFETRMKKVVIPSDDRGEMMGHSVKSIRGRELYGDELELLEKLKVANRIVLPVVPPHLE